MIKKLLWAFVGILIVVPIVASLAGVKMSQFTAMGDAAKEMVTPPEVVTTAEVRQEEWQPRISSVGSVVAVQGTIVSTEGEGVVREIKFEAGSDVKAGDLLVQLDIDTEMAQLREAEAAAELAKVSYSRAKELIESRNIAQAEFDQAAAELKQAAAKIDNIKTLISRKTVRAPFAGKLGIRKISVGQFLNKGSEVVSLQALQPIYVDFSLPQQQLADVAEGLKVVITTDAYPNRKFEGKVTAINPDVDRSTRNVRVQATLPNDKNDLKPGMFASVDVILPETEQVLFIPTTAVQHAAFGDSVFVIEEDKNPKPGTTSTLIVRQQVVRLGRRQGDFVMVTDGLKKGETIVSTGVFKLRPSASVEIDNTLAPQFKLNPEPANT